MKTIAIIARIVVGLVFIFSGFVKGVDPWGSTYKIIDYFTAFGLSFLNPTAFILGVLRDAAEFIIGVALLLGLRMKVTSWAVLAFMSFFTILTFILALTNPVSDCGCFGDAIVLTNWQTFYKNVALLFLTLIVFFYRKKYVPAYSPAVEWGWVVGMTVVIVGLSVYCYRHLPILDFRPYYIGADIPHGMTVPDGKPSDKFKTLLYYEKDGVVKEFDDTNYPWDDTTWIWKDSKTILVEKGYQPPIHDFGIMTRDGIDITDEVLADEGYTFLFIAYRLEKSNKDALASANDIAEFCEEKGYRFYCLTASPDDDIEQLTSELGLKYDFCFTDEITLKTIIRANPGLVLLKEGVILNKWHYNDVPQTTEFSPNLMSYSIKSQLSKSDNRLMNEWLLVLIVVSLIFYQFRQNRSES